MRTDSIAYGSYCNYLPSASLCQALCKAFQETFPKVFHIFGHNILPYKKVDLDANAIPAMLIYPTQSVIFSECWYNKTSLNFDYIFPGGAMIRERSTEIAMVISESINYLILKNNNFFDSLKYGAPDIHGRPTWGQFPALVELGELIETDFSDVNNLTIEQDSVVLRSRVSYTIDTVQWWQYIQEILGNNILDPCQFLYPIITDYQDQLTLISSINPETQEVVT